MRIQGGSSFIGNLTEERAKDRERSPTVSYGKHWLQGMVMKTTLNYSQTKKSLSSGCPQELYSLDSVDGFFFIAFYVISIATGRPGVGWD